MWDKVKNVSCKSLKNNKLICHSQRRFDFTNDVKISRYNQLEIVLGDNVFSDTLVDTEPADELNCFYGIAAFHTRDWELVKLIARTKLRRSHVCLRSQSGNSVLINGSMTASG